MSKTFRIACATMIAVACIAGLTGVASAKPKLVNLLIDTGPGGAAFRNQAYQARAAAAVNEIVSGLGLTLGDRLTMRTFGNPGLLDQMAKKDFNRDITFAYRGAKLEDIAPFIEQKVAALGGLHPDDKSDMMYALGNLATDLDCGSVDVTTIILSNGIEAGEIAGNRFILKDAPHGTPFCGSAYFVGLWVNDPKPTPGMKAEGEKLFLKLAHDVGFERAEIRR